MNTQIPQPSQDTHLTSQDLDFLNSIFDLVRAGADLNRLNDRGQTALVCAVFRDNEPIAQALLKAGADPHLGTQTPAQVAQFFDLPNMQKLLAN